MPEDAGRRPLASVEEVAAYLGVPVATLYRWRSRSEGPPGFRVGRFVRYRWADVDAWLEQRRDQTHALLAFDLRARRAAR